MAKVSTKRSKGKPEAASKKGSKNASAKEKKSRSETYVLCPYTEQKVWISKATLSDLKPKKGSKANISLNAGSGHKKRLWTISSPQIRQNHYADVAQSLSIYEQSLLPSSGGRSWEVSVTLSEPNSRVLFRSWKGRMELACLPHLIDRIPKPPIWPGKRNQPADDYQAMQGEEDCSHNGKGKKKDSKQAFLKSLMTREISMLSQVAWDVLKPKYDHPAPTVAIKWKSPDAKTFTSRKQAWEHAKRLSKEEVIIERNLKGIGASGKLLKEFVPTAKTALEVGRLRFVRDGLWVVGQETSWQDDREEELLAQQEELEEAAASKIYTSGLQLYVAENRHSYREEHGTNLTQADKALRHQWRCLPPKEQEIWNQKVQEQFEDSSIEESDIEEENQSSKSAEDGSDVTDDDESDESSVEYISRYQYFIQQRRHDYRHEQQMKLEAIGGSTKKKFTLSQADKELRQQWKEMDEQQQDDWIAKLKQMEEATDEQDEKEDANEIKNETDHGVKGDLISSVTVKTDHSDGTGFEEEKKTEEVGFGLKNSTSPSRVLDPEKICSIPDRLTSSITKSEPVKKATEKKDTAMITKQAKKKSTKKVTSKYCLKPDQISKCHDACMEHYDTVMRTVKARDLSRELADGFDVLRERGHGRFDMEIPAFDTPDFSFLNSFGKTPWMPIVRTILGDDVVLIHKGSFMSLPGAGAQVYHQDGVHLTTQTQRPCHAINVFVPLVDLNSRNGPTEFVLGSHVLGHDGYDRDFLDTPKPSAGTPIIFDYRLGHRGLANSSQHCRPIVYCTYARAADGKEFRDSVNFSRKRYHKIGNLSAKPISREERRNKRKRSIESAMAKKEIEEASKISMVDKPEEVKALETVEKAEAVNGSALDQGRGDGEISERASIISDTNSEKAKAS